LLCRAPEVIDGALGDADPLAFEAERAVAGAVVIRAHPAAGGAIDLTGRARALDHDVLVARELSRGGRGERRNVTARTSEQEQRRER
jgi:hypothetical protein